MVDRITYAFGVAFSVTALFSALLVVLKETSPNLLAWMAALTGHHWATHGALDLVLFLVLGLLLLRKAPGTARALALFVAGSTVLSSVIVTAYFLFQ